MDKLSLTLLELLFVFGGSGLTATMLLFFLITGVVTLNCGTLFSLTTLFTYYFYGLFGLLYTMISSLSFLLCATMYWYELSFDDFKKSANNMREQTIKDLPQELEAEKINNDLDDKLQVLRKYLNKYKVLGQTFVRDKLKLTDERIEKYQTSYKKISSKYDTVIDTLYNYLKKLRTLTENVPGFKFVYNVYDEILQFKTLLESIRSMNKSMYNMPHELQEDFNTTQQVKTPKNSTTSSSTETSTNISTDTETSEESTTATTIKPSTSPKNKDFNPLKSPIFTLPSENMNDLKELEEMQKKFNAIPPDEKQKMDEMAMQLFGNMKLNDVITMMGGIEAMSGTTSSTSTTSGKNSSKNIKKK